MCPKAQEHANGRRIRSRRVKQHEHLVYVHVESLLVQQQWSPEQMAHRLSEHLANICGKVESDDASVRMVRRGAGNWSTSPYDRHAP